MRLTVVSCPAMYSSRVCAISSSSPSTSPSSSALMSAVSRSSAGLARFHAIIPAATWVSSASAAAMAATMAGSLTGSSERTTVPDSCLMRSWSAGGVPSISAITANGSGKASASTRSTRPWRSAASSMSSTSPVTRGCSAWMARGVNAFDTSRRSRVWSGGSRSSMDRPPERVTSLLVQLLAQVEQLPVEDIAVLDRQARAEQPGHVLVAGEQPEPDGVPVDGRPGPQRRVLRIGVVGKAGRERVEQRRGQGLGHGGSFPTVTCSEIFTYARSLILLG